MVKILTPNLPVQCINSFFINQGLLFYHLFKQLNDIYELFSNIKNSKFLIIIIIKYVCKQLYIKSA